MNRLKTPCLEDTESSATTTCQKTSHAWLKSREMNLGLEIALDKGNVPNWKHNLDPSYCWQLLTLLLHYFNRRRILLLENH